MKLPFQEQNVFRLDEFYCPDPACDCQKVLVMFMEVRDGTIRPHGALSYGWQSVNFYQKWGRFPKSEARELVQGYLEPLSPQLEHAELLLDAFCSRVKKDERFSLPQ